MSRILTFKPIFLSLEHFSLKITGFNLLAGSDTKSLVKLILSNKFNLYLIYLNKGSLYKFNNIDKLEFFFFLYLSKA